MNTFITDVRLTLAPPRDGEDGLLPPLLVGLTAVTGLVDAFSYLVLGHVFVANMTGNVVFLNFALAGERHRAQARRPGSDHHRGGRGQPAGRGALLVIHVRIVFPLVIALLILIAVALTGVTRSPAAA